MKRWALLGLALVAGCSSGTSTAGGGRSFPLDTLVDVVSYHQAAAVFTVTGSEDDPADLAHVQTYGEGYVSRQLTVRVLRSVWTAPGARPLPSIVSFPAWGWTVHDHERHAAGPQGAARLEVGGTYIAPFRYERCQWGAEAEAALAVDPTGHRVIDHDSARTPVAHLLRGPDVDAVAAKLTSTVRVTVSPPASC